MKTKLIATLAAALIGAVTLFAPHPAQAQEQPTVFAAASLRNALDDISAAWTQAEDKTVTISYAGSSALARQIEEGAPADLFISADLDWMAYLDERDLIRSDTQLQLLGNRIVLIAHEDADAEIEIAPGFDLANLLGEERLAMANVDAVPAGRYGKAALEKLGVWSDVEPNVAQAENVRAALMLVALGEAPYGIVYQTDAAAEPGLRIVGVFPEETHPPIIYPAAVIAESANPDAEAFLAFLQSQTAKELFEAQGFEFLVPVISN